MKRLILLLLSFGAILFVFSSCRAEYRQDLTPHELADHIERELSGKSYRNLDDKSAFYGGALPLEEGTFFALRVAEDGSDLDEFGIFACADESAAQALASEVKSYLETLDRTNREWYLSYIPEEVPKLQNAEVKTYGRYVAYAILSENERNRVFDLVKQKLLK